MRCALKVSAFVTLNLIFAIFSTHRLESQSTSTPPNAPSVSLPGTQSPFLGSAPEGTATPEVLQIDFKDAIERGLRNNLGLLLAGDHVQEAQGQRWQQLSELLPNVSIRALEDAQTTSLAALGFRGNVFPVAVPRVLGPFNYFDLRANASQTVFNYRTLQKEKAASQGLKAAQLSLKDARELVVLAVGNSYLLAIASAARVETAEAQVKSAQALYDKAADQQKAGLTP